LARRSNLKTVTAAGDDLDHRMRSRLRDRVQAVVLAYQTGLVGLHESTPE
jgi:hypothetical protein